MKRRLLWKAVLASASFVVIVFVSVAITWQHWWWPVRFAQVWVNGELTDKVAVYRGVDGRYLLYYRNRSEDWLMHTVVLPGKSGTVDVTDACALGDRCRWPASVAVFPFGAYRVSIPVDSSPLSLHSEMELDPHLAYQPHGFSFVNRLENMHWPGLGKQASYRVVIK